MDLSDSRPDGLYPASFAQRRLWFLDRVSPGRAIYNITWLLEEDGPLCPARLARAIETVIARHGVLRTTFVEVDGEPMQRVGPADRIGKDGNGADRFRLPVVDLSALPPARRTPEADRLARRDEDLPFDLERGPLLRTTLLRFGPERHRLQSVFHHTVADGWSLLVYTAEIEALYAADTTHADACLDPLRLQYGEWARRQRAAAKAGSDELAEDLDYWRRTLDGAPVVLEVPTDRPRSGGGGDRAGWTPLALPTEVVDRLAALGRADGHGLFAALAAGLQALLHRLSGEEDLVHGFAARCRDTPEERALIGFFVKTLPLRARLEATTPFRELVAAAGAGARDALAHRRAPFHRLVEAVRPDRTADHTPLFQAMLVLQNRRLEDVTLPCGWTLRHRILEHSSAKFDLTFNLTPAPAPVAATDGTDGSAPAAETARPRRGGGLDGGIEYRKDLFDATTAARLARRFEVLLAAAAADPDRPVGELPLLTAAERHAVTVEWARPVGPDLEDLDREAIPFPEHLARRAAERSDAVAVAGPGRTLTYGGLLRAVRLLAGRLRALGVGRPSGAAADRPEDPSPVGLSMSRSVEALVGLLAIQEAGAPYLPLDPAYPSDRLAFMVEDAGVRLALTAAQAGGDGAPPLPESVRTVPVDLDALTAAAGRAAEAPAGRRPLDPGRDPDRLAYVIYTSGSTGRPKGVMVTHRTLGRFAASLARAFGVGPESCYLQFSSLNFDASVSEIFPTLWAGGRLAVGGADELEPGAPLARFMAARRVTNTLLVPSVLATLPDEIPLPALATAVTGGDACTPELAGRWVRRQPPGGFVNAYGPTEVTVVATVGPVGPVGPSGAAAENGTGAPPIGRALDPARVRVLDPGLRPVPVGAAGELCVGGANLARGYLGRPALTAERFVPDPLGRSNAGSSAGSGGRLYRTGDLVRWLPDGRIDFLGRIDHQVKVRGFRIELGEVEARLAEHPDVAEAVAAAVRPDGPADEKPAAILAAYVVPRDGAEIDAAGLRAFLAERLPDSMVPSAVLTLDALPRTPNGKLDRRALPVPGPAELAAAGGRELTAPRTPTEELLAAIWSTALGLAAPSAPAAADRTIDRTGDRVIGRESHFFELGGHSLIATRVASRVRSAFGIELPVRVLFEHPTLAALAERIDALRASGGDAAAEGSRPSVSGPPIYPLAQEPGGGRILPLSFAQERLWLIDRLTPGSTLYTVPVLFDVGTPERPAAPAALARALAGVVARHEVLRTTFDARGDEPVQVVGPPRPVPGRCSGLDRSPSLPVVDLSSLPEPRRRPESERIAAAEIRRPFDLAGDEPLLRVVYLVDQVGPISQVDQRGATAPAGRLLLLVHHIVFDGWSLGVFIRELGTLYRAFAGGEAPGSRLLPPLPIQYGDFSVWQRRWLAGAALEGHLAWWRQALAGMPEALDLPYDRPLPESPSFRAGLGVATLAPETTDRLERLARDAAATPFMVLVAAWATLLSRATGQDDLAVGSPVAGRDREEIEGLIGFFVNTLVLRLDLRPEAGPEVGPEKGPEAGQGSLSGGRPSFRRAVELAREACLGAFAHQAVPFEKLVGELAPERDPRRNPLVQALFVFHEAGTGASGRRAGFDGDLVPHRLENGSAKFDLTLTVEPLSSDGLRAALEWSADRFETATGRRLLGHFVTLLDAALAAPERPVTALPLLTAAERHQVVVEAADTGADLGGVLGGNLGVEERVPTLAELFARRAAAVPERIAVASGARQVSFGALAAAAETLRRALRAAGVGSRGARREDLVAVCVERSPEMVAALLATVGAGAAYVPLDPAYPVDRLAYMLHDAGARVLLTGDGAPEELIRSDGSGTGGFDGVVLSLSGLFDPGLALGTSAPFRPAPAPGPDALSYVLYTSGSTGKPKAAMNHHAGIHNRLAWQQRRFPLGESDRVLQKTPYSFDVSTWEIFLPLVVGARLELAPPDGHRDPALLTRALMERRITALQLVPSQLSLLLDEHPRRDDRDHRDVSEPGGEGHAPDRRARAACRNLRRLFLGGEALTPELGERACAVLPDGAELFNWYGPAEAAVDVTSGAWSPTAGAAGATVPIGRPLDNTAVHLLDPRDPTDPHAAPVPLGQPGELCVGGVHVGRGYLGRPGLTAERFVPDPFAAAAGPRGAGARLYRTGDLARRLPDGRLEFLGRIDHQVKVRGQRIELGEVEAALRALPGVGGAVVVPRGEGADRRLVAYLVADPMRGDQGPSDTPSARAAWTESLRRALAERLPDAMVPAVFTVLDAFPTTPSGKIDRRALPEPDAGALGGTAAGADRVPPRTPVEEALVGIWQELLGVDAVGVRDDFFRLGGHSLLGARVLSRVRRAFGVEVPLARLFAAPTVEGLAREVDALRTALSPSAPAPAMARLPRPAASDGPAVFPCSWAQQRLWFLDRFESGTALYNLPVVYRLENLPDRPDLPALASALRRIVVRHESLRTTFTEGPDGPLQVIAPDTEAGHGMPMPVVDLSGLPGTAARRELARRTAEEVARPFDLEAGPLVRALVLRSAEEHRLALTMHHVVSDGWSTGVLARELGVLYPALSETGASGASAGCGAAAALPSLPSLPIQYADFAAWQRAWLDGPVLEALLEHWRSHLDGLPAALELPADRPRPPAQSFAGRRLRRRLPAELGPALRGLARRRGTTLFTVAFAAFAGLLGRLAGRDDLAVGAPAANRGREEIEGLIGFFVNTLVLRADLSGAPSFDRLLERARGEVLTAFDHQDLPFDRLVEELRPERDPARNPLVQVMLVVESEGERRLPPGLGWSEVHADHPTAKFDLTLHLREEEDADLVATIEVAADLFDAATAERWVGWFATLAVSASAAPGTPLASLPLLAASERHQLTVEWPVGATAGPVPDAPLGELFADRAAAVPEAIALVEAGAAGADGDLHLTYGELDRRSAHLARRLLAIPGVGLDTPVGLAAERSADLVVGVLAIARAGAAYVPFDASYPDERLAFVLEDLAPPVIVADRAGAERIAALGRSASVSVPLPRIVPLGAATGSHEPDQPVADLLPERSNPDSLAYVVYTSGSTGRPKGVAVPHRAVTRLVRGSAFAALGPDETFLQFAPIAFDASTFELWAPLLAGGRLVVAPAGPLATEVLVGLVGAHRVTTLWLTTGLFHQVVDTVLPGQVSSTGSADLAHLAGVRQLLTGGDVVAPEACRRVLEQLPATALINCYGPTENTTFTSSHPVAAADPAAGAVPIGRPIARTTVHVVDGALRPLPIGVPGELVTGGAGLARGYAGRPALTAERFVPDPFAAGPEVAGARLYRTGDLVRLRPDGVVEFLGRIDQQVKIRGFRIEPGEIESALTGHPEVAEAVVVARRSTGAGAGGDKRLVAYVVPARPERPSAELTGLLRDHLAARLPAYMVPAAFVVLAELPLGATGKVDRRALPEPDPAAERSGARVAPRTPTEQVIADLWRELLGLGGGGAAAGDEIGVDDDFFHLGGHSLLAARLVTRLRAVFGVELPLRRIFETPTVAGLARAVGAQAVEEGRRGEEETGAPTPIERLPVGPDAPLSFGQERLWFLDRLTPGDASYTVPTPLTLTGDLVPAALERALGALIARHEVLRTVYPEVDGRPVQRVIPVRPLRLPLARVDLSGLAPERRRQETARLVAADARRPFDLARGPVLRAFLVVAGAAEHVLALDVHHIATDGWSLGVMLRDLGALYGLALDGGRGADGLPPLPVRYADYAAWQRRWLEGDGLAGPLAYWRERLTPTPAVLELPTDRPRPAVESPRGAVVTRRLGAGAVAALRGLGRERGASLFMVLLAGLDALLGRITGQEDVAVGTPVANRTRAEIEPLVGFFVNTLVIRADLTALTALTGRGDAPSFAALLGRVRDAALGAWAHAEVPFERLVEELAPDRSLARSPLFQVLLAHLSASEVGRRQRWGDLEVELPSAYNGSAKFDLSLHSVDEGEALSLGLVYRTELFDATTVARLAGWLETLLLAAAADPGVAVSALPLLASAERHQVLAEWGSADGAAPVPVSVGPCLHQLVYAQAARTPDAEALVAGRERLTYRELIDRAERIAARLRSLGVGPEVRVGICAERSAHLVPGLLGVLRAGGAYVPLDPGYPRERLELMIEDSAAAAVLADGRHRELARSLVAGTGATVVPLESDPLDRYTETPPARPSIRSLGWTEVRLGEAADGLRVVSPASASAWETAGARPTPGNLAYLIYTSGSTGRPKGVAIEHRAAVALVRWSRGAFTDAELAGVAAVTSISFDLSVFEIFVPLARGGRVILAADALALPEAPAADEVTLVNTVPSSAAELARARSLPTATGRTTVNLAGEPLQRDLVERLFAIPGVGRVCNLYGPSEDTTYSTWTTVPRDERREPTIGRAIAGTRSYVVDPAGAPVPIGIPGELLLGGAGLARGYLGRPGLTAGRWVPDALSGDSAGEGARLYRTGDLVRRLADGRLDFLGRIDHQVKVRGFRIELGEIEAALARHPAVAEAAVIAWDDPVAGKALAGYVRPVDAAAGEATPDRLRQHLAAHLPAYMVPADVVVLEALPHTPSGKVDRRALPLPERAPDATGAEGKVAAGDAPRNQVEEILAGLWGELLGGGPAGRSDDFFRRGGHSLLAARLVSRLRTVFGVEVPLRQVFETPTLEALAKAIERALATGGGEAGEAGEGIDQIGQIDPIGRPREGGADLPLSFGQERLWFLDQLQDGDAGYTVPSPLRLRGPLSRPRLARALSGLLARHEVLRTTYAAPEGKPVQRVAPLDDRSGAATAIALPLIDLTSLPGPVGAHREPEARRLLVDDARRPFDLARGPVLRAALIALGAETSSDAGGEDHILLLDVHHIATDGWSIGVLADDLEALYRGGDPGLLPPLPIRYADYAAWQRRRLAGPTLDAELAWWRARLAPPPAPLELPTDRPRPRVESPEGAVVSRRLGPDAAARVRALAAREGATAFMVLLTAFDALLTRITGATDLAVGTAIANRSRSEIEGLVGFFVNTLVVRVDAGAPGEAGGSAPSFRDLLARVREASLGAFAHAEVPFERLVGELHPERELSGTPLFQVLFAHLAASEIARRRVWHEGDEGDEGAREPLVAELLSVHNRSAKFDLSLHATEGVGELSGATPALVLSAEYRTALFDATTMRRLLGHLETLLLGAAEEPGRPIDALPLLTAAERHQVAVEWLCPVAPALEETLVHEMVARAAAETPDAVALSDVGPDGPRQVTYGELVARSRRLAGSLAARLDGTPGSERAIGVAVERSVELVVTLLAVLEAGAFYVPLDPSYPAERLAFMVEDADLALIVTRGDGLPEGLAGAADGKPVPVLDLDRLAPAAELPGAAPVSPERAAYALYTSGSTGRPKGVVVPHRGIVRLVMGRGFARSGADATFLQLAPVPFDASTLEIWTALCRGGRLALAPPGPLAVEELIATAARERVTELFVTAGLFHQVAEADLTPLAGLRSLMSGGDVVDPEAFRRVRRALPRTLLVDAYGPTENTTFTTVHPMAPAADRERAEREIPSPVPIGRPIDHTTVRVVDRALRPVPIGVPGELVTGGAGLARGYLGRPGLTAERFVPDPGDRVYRTGDLVRWRPDGSLAFLARIDHQVKVRGFRIEPGEIEAALTALPKVAEAVVVARAGDVAGDQRLVAYVVTTAERAADAGDDGLVGHLRSALGERLPAYMVPSAFVVLDTFPLGPTGKVDRKALPDPGLGADGAAEGSRRAPGTETERALAAIWAELLGVEEERVGVDDDFFALGGHSLLATQVISRVRSAFGAALPLRRLFEAPTVAGLARAIDAAAHLSTEVATDSGPVPIPRDGTPLPLSFGQERFWFLDLLEGGGAGANIPLNLALAGPLRPAALARALAELARRHEVLRTAYPTEAGRPVLAVAPVGSRLVADLPVVDLSGREAALRPLLEHTARRPFDLAHGPVLRAVLVRVRRDEHVLSLILHHIAGDGWSIGVLLRELGALYEAFAAGRPSPLPEPRLQYADFAAWQRRRLAGPALAAELAWWRDRLGSGEEGDGAGGPPPLDLPADRPRPAVPSGRGDLRERPLAFAGVEALRALAGEEGATLFMLALAAFGVLLHRLTGATDLAVGTPVANRDRAELEDLIGFFVNTLVIRADLEGDPTFRTLLGRVRDAALGAYDHAEVPFEKLVEELQPERSLDANPLFQVMATLVEPAAATATTPETAVARGGVGSGGRPRRWGALAVEPLAVHTGTAKFDLHLHIEDAGDRLRAGIEYATDRFDGTTVERLLARLATLFEAIGKDPDRPLSALPALPAAERHQVLLEWCHGAPLEPPSVCLHELVAAQAARTPDAEALVSGTERWTYRQLRRRALAIAHRLRWLVPEAAMPEARVAVALSRTGDLVATLLGVLEAGAAYVPLDPDYPPARLALMLEDSGARAVITQSALTDRMGDHGLPTLLVDRIATGDGPSGSPHPSAESLFWNGRRSEPENLAYLIYTSGSTGRPKAVAIEHRSAVALVRWAGTAFSQRELAAVAASTSVSFDLSVFEIFVPLARGGTVVLAADALEVPRLPAADEITLLDTVPSAAEALLAAGGLPPSVATVNLAGEPLKRELAERIAAQPGVRRVVDLYGPSEDTTYSTWAPWTAADRRAGRAPTIGRPVAGTRAVVIDRDGRPAPIGVAGELCLGGLGLARGYLGRPAATAERFVPDPFAAPRSSGWPSGGPSGWLGGRLYRTGDLVRWLPEGRLDFLGRIDHQVKIRGFRIEPREIETALAAVPGVAEAVVVPRPDPASPSGGQRLVAYVCPDRSGAETLSLVPDPARWRAALARTLPAHMVPAAFVVLESLPRTPNGKLDRRALPEPEAGAGRRDDGAVRQLSPVEELIAGIWAEVLALEAASVGPEDDFFALGGHSLVAVRMLARVRDLLGVDVPLRRLFESPTLAGLAAVADALRSDPEEPAGTVGTGPVPRASLSGRTSAADDALPLSSGQRRLWFLDRLEPGDPTFNLPLTLRLRSVTAGIDRPALVAALGELVRRHEVLRTTYPVDLSAGVGAGAAAGAGTGQPRQAIAPAGSPADSRGDGAAAVSLPVIDLARLPEECREAEARRRVTELARRPFDLARGPVWRAALVDLGPDRSGQGAAEQVFAFVVHHIAADGVSLEILRGELVTLYDALASGRPATLAGLPEPAVQYADFALWERQRLGTPDLAERLEAWADALTGDSAGTGAAPEPLALPTDRPRATSPGGGTRRGGLEILRLPDALASGLRALSRAEGATLFMTLLAGFDLLLHGATGRTDLLVGTPVANRDRLELEGTVGFFVDTRVLRADLDGDPTFRELLARVRESALDADSRGSVPFDRLVEAVARRRETDGDDDGAGRAGRAGWTAGPGAGPPASLFQVMFALWRSGARPAAPERAGEHAATAAGVAFGSFGVHTDTAQFDLTVYAEDAGDRLSVMAEYDRALYDRATAERILGLYRRLLVAAVEDPEARISELLRRIGGVTFGRPAEASAAGPREAPIGPASQSTARRVPQEAEAGPRSARRDRLAARRARLTPEQRAALARRLRGAAERSGVAAGGSTGPNDRDGGNGGGGGDGPAAAQGVVAAGSLVPIELPADREKGPSGGRPPLFLVHPAGGDVLCFHQLGRHLAAIWSDQGSDEGSGERSSERAAVYGLQSLGLADGAAPHQTIEAMAEGYLEEVRGVQPSGPYRLAGWSLGGVVAFEMARRLDSAGEEVSFLGIFDTVPRLSDLLGDLADPERAAELLADDARWLHDMAVYVRGVWGKDLGLGYRQLCALDPDRRLEEFLAALDRAGVLPAGTGVAHLRRLLDVFKTNCRAAQLYAPGIYPGRITLFRAAGPDQAVETPPEGERLEVPTSEDDAPALSPDAAAAMAAYAADPTLGWSAFSPRPVEVVPVPGTHVSLLAEPHVATLASRLADRLAGRGAESPVPVDAPSDDPIPAGATPSKETP